MKKQSFILLKSKKKGVYTIYSKIYEGSSVIERKSTGIQIRKDQWNKKEKRIKSNIKIDEPNNEKLDRIENDFKDIISFGPNASEQSCVMKFFEKTLIQEYETRAITPSTFKKYYSILNGLKKTVQEKFHSDCLPIYHLRYSDSIQKITSGFLSNQKHYLSEKENKTVYNYLSVLKSYVDKWNKYSGTQSPINTQSFFNFVSKRSEKRLAEFLTYNQLESIKNYQPTGRHTANSQLLAKNIFLFQYFSGGIRFIDAVLLTIKNISTHGLIINNHKSKSSHTVPFIFQMVECLKYYFKNQYQDVIYNLDLLEIDFPNKIIQQLCRLPSSALKLKYIDFKSQILSHNNSNDTLLKSIDIIEDEITRRFFEKLRDLPNQFIFPILNIDDFDSKEGVIRKVDQEQEYLIHKARTRTNSSLKWIAKELKIPKLTTHIQRHSIANHLVQEKVPIEHIQKILGHSDLKTTKTYINERIGYDHVVKTLKDFYSRKK